MQGLRTATLLKRDSCKTCDILRTPYFTEHPPVAASDSFRFPACNFIKKTFWKRCFSVNFAKLLRTSFNRTPPDDCFLNFDKFFRTPLWYSTSEKLLISCRSCRISTSRYSKNYFTGVFQAFYTETRSSHSKDFIYLKFLKMFCEEVNS